MKISTMILFVLLIAGAQAAAEEVTCRIKAPVQDDRWAIIYKADTDGNRGDIIWKGKIAANEEVSIKCDSGHIRYSYAVDSEQPYEGDLSVMCDDNRVFLLP